MSMKNPLTPACNCYYTFKINNTFAVNAVPSYVCEMTFLGTPASDDR